MPQGVPRQSADAYVCQHVSALNARASVRARTNGMPRRKLVGSEASGEADARKRDDEAIRRIPGLDGHWGAFVAQLESATGRTLPPKKRGHKPGSKA